MNHERLYGRIVKLDKRRLKHKSTLKEPDTKNKRTCNKKLELFEKTRIPLVYMFKPSTSTE